MKQSIGELDVRGVPTYSCAEVARYLTVSPSTVRAWIRGTTTGDKRQFQPVIERPNSDSNLLSFVNLIEIHVLSSIRRNHRISLQKVRHALNYINNQFQTAHPLANLDFQTDQVDLFVDKFGEIFQVSGRDSGQISMRAVVEAYLDRIERNPSGLAIKLYPFTRTELTGLSIVDQPKVIVIDPQVSFGRPVLVNTGIPTAILAERFKSGESISELRRDYDCKQSLIEEAIRYEQQIAA